eukprot:m51a1_g1317 hypothetical protein (85) ;mRNA; f:228680-228934
MEKMEVFLAPGCSSCDAVREFVNARGIAVKQHFVDREPESLDNLQKATGSRKLPVLRNGDAYLYEADAICHVLEDASRGAAPSI